MNASPAYSFNPLCKTSDHVTEAQRRRRRRKAEWCCDLVDRTCNLRGRIRRSSTFMGRDVVGRGAEGGASLPADPNPKLQQGERLMYPKTESLTDCLIGRPLVEIDEFYTDTFVVVNSRYDISRFHLSRVRWARGGGNQVLCSSVDRPSKLPHV